MPCITMLNLGPMRPCGTRSMSENSRCFVIALMLFSLTSERF